MLLEVMHQNDIDVLVNWTITIPPAKIGYASEPSVNRPHGRFPTSANLGIPEFALNAAMDGFHNISNSTRPESPRTFVHGVSWIG